MNSKAIFILCALTAVSSVSVAQNMSFGFRAGLSYSKFIGPSEMSGSGQELESYSFASGFHIGVAADYAVTDLFGFRGELLFSQRGTEYTYDGDSYYFLSRNDPGNEKLVFGKRKVDMGVSMANLSLPLVAYYKIGFVEILGGVNVSVLVTSTGGGSLELTQGMTPTGNVVDSFAITMQHNYNKDGARQAGRSDLAVEYDGSTIFTPSTTGAYYDYDVKEKNLYNAFDFGLTGGVNFYLNDGLFVGARAIYSLTDIDRNEYDISYYQLDGDNQYVQRADKNQNITIHASVGFLF